jgi:hypothetical protein
VAVFSFLLHVTGSGRAVGTEGEIPVAATSL